jgi:uncharacterized membrane protein
MTLSLSASVFPDEMTRRVTSEPTMRAGIRPHRRSWPLRGRGYLRLTGAVVMAGWLAGLVVFSIVLYQRHNLTADFATYNQAWSLLGHGHLNPYDTIYGSHPFWKSDFELVIWPLALLHLVTPQPIVLLFVQDLAVAASGFVAFVWIADYLEWRRVTWWTAVAVCVLVLVVTIVNPGVYQTLLYDFHIEPIATVFVLLAARDLWWGRLRRSWIWIALVLLCGSFAAITLVGLGVSAVLAGRTTRRQGALVIVTALAWLGLISLLGADAGSGLDNYAYLANRAHLSGASGIALIVGGMLAHPSRVVNVIHERLHYVWMLIKPVGIVGLASAWGFGVPFVVMLTNALNAQYGFIFQAFQNFAVFSFLLFGTVTVLVWMSQRIRLGWIVALVVGIAVTAQALTYGLTASPGNIRWAVSRVSNGAGAAMTTALARTPSQAEVIATIGIMGRFSGRPAAYWFGPGGTTPVTARPVVFVFDPANENTIPQATPADDEQAIAFVRDTLGARTLVDRSGVVALEWQPPAGTTRVVFPPVPRPPDTGGTGVPAPRPPGHRATG